MGLYVDIYSGRDSHPLKRSIKEKINAILNKEKIVKHTVNDIQEFLEIIIL
jgi:hypothetical protein